MQHYANRHGNSGVQSFEFNENSITVEFPYGCIYLYNSENPGSHHVEQMKKLAIQGSGLNGYINKYVRKNYAQKLQ